MIGGLLKSTSRLALLAAAGLFVGGVAMPSAKAADLGGDCCADLEERVAELEATTARKGNRKMSLTVTGQVNRMIMFWDDGINRGAYYGIDNINSSSRFSFLGSAKISPTLSAGFEIMIEGEGTAASNRVSQLNEDGTFSQLTYNNATNTSTGVNNSGNADGFFGDARRVAAWIEDKNLGRLTVGRYETAGAVGTIDLGGIGVVTGFGTNALLNGNFGVRPTTGGFGMAVWSQFLDPAAYQSRQEVLRYDSPTLAGFVLSASVSEASNSFAGNANWGVMLRYAGEFSGFRIAAGAGYEHIGDTYTPTNASSTGIVQLTLLPGTPTSTFAASAPDINAWGVGLSGMHVPTGLFLQGSWQNVEYNNSTSATTGYWGETCAASTAAGNVIGTAVGPATCNPKADAHWWQIQGGISKNWFGWGNTSLYGEYSKMYNFGAETGPGRDYNSSTTTLSNGFTAIHGVTSDVATVWGLGVVQNFDAAATEWYLGYRNYAIDLNGGAGATCETTVTTTLGTTASKVNCGINDFHLITTGLRVKF